MITIRHTVKSAAGMHARPAGQMAQLARRVESATITRMEQTVDLKRIFGVLGLGISQGDTVTITLVGEQEKEAEAELRQILEAEL